MPILTPGNVVFRQTWAPMDADAAAYIAAVEQADQQELEERTKRAIDNFVLGCKADGIWDAIKASCILAGARTLEGALVPLKGTAPTNFNFVSGDYDRKTGLVGDGSTKYLNSNYGIATSLQNNCHMSGYASSLSSGTWIGALDAGRTRGSSLSHTGSRLYSALPSHNSTDTTTLGFRGISRNSSSTYLYRRNQFNENTNLVSVTENLSWVNFVFARRGEVFPVGIETYTASRLAFYSIGESLDLAKLDGRVSDLITAISTAF